MNVTPLFNQTSIDRDAVLEAAVRSAIEQCAERVGEKAVFAFFDGYINRKDETCVLLAA